jgi:hypothetical protein
VSGLAGRISELDRQLGRCPDRSRATIELVYAGSPQAAKPGSAHCGCGEPPKQITALLAFEPYSGIAT